MYKKIIKNVTESNTLGFEWSQELVDVADSLYHQQIPKVWCLLFGSNTTFSNYPLGSFLADLSSRYTHIDKCLTMGRDKTPAFNLGAFYCPQGLLSLVKYETMKTKNGNDDIGCVESLVFQTEMTARDKEHV